jgi:hypothetical protein
LALEYARLCQALTATQPEELLAFDSTYAEEAKARALALNGNLKTARRHLDRAKTLAQEIADDGDREIILSDLAGEDWHGLT